MKENECPRGNQGFRKDDVPSTLAPELLSSHLSHSATLPPRTVWFSH